MKLYKGDTITFKFGNTTVKGKVLTNGGSWNNGAKIKLLDNLELKNLINKLACYNYKCDIFYDNHVNKNVKLIRPGWFRRQQKPFLKRLKFLFLNRF